MGIERDRHVPGSALAEVLGTEPEVVDRAIFRENTNDTEKRIGEMVSTLSSVAALTALLTSLPDEDRSHLPPSRSPLASR